MRTILLAEDDVHYRELLRDELKNQGYHVLEASGVAAALAIGHEHDIDVAILDFRYGSGSAGPTGIDIAKGLSERIPKIMITEQADRNDVMRAVRVTDNEGFPLFVNYFDKRSIDGGKSGFFQFAIQSAVQIRGTWQRNARQRIPPALYRNYWIGLTIMCCGMVLRLGATAAAAGMAIEVAWRMHSHLNYA